MFCKPLFCLVSYQDGWSLAARPKSTDGCNTSDIRSCNLQQPSIGTESKRETQDLSSSLVRQCTAQLAINFSKWAACSRGTHVAPSSMLLKAKTRHKM